MAVQSGQLPQRGVLATRKRMSHREAPGHCPGPLLNQCRLHKTKKHTRCCLLAPETGLSLLEIPASVSFRKGERERGGKRTREGAGQGEGAGERERLERERRRKGGRENKGEGERVRESEREREGERGAAACDTGVRGRDCTCQRRRVEASSLCRHSLPVRAGRAGRVYIYMPSMVHLYAASGRGG